MQNKRKFTIGFRSGEELEIEADQINITDTFVALVSFGENEEYLSHYWAIDTISHIKDET